MLRTTLQKLAGLMTSLLLLACPPQGGGSGTDTADNHTTGETACKTMCDQDTSDDVTTGDSTNPVPTTSQGSTGTDGTGTDPTSGTGGEDPLETDCEKVCLQCPMPNVPDVNECVMACVNHELCPMQWADYIGCLADTMSCKDPGLYCTATSNEYGLCAHPSACGDCWGDMGEQCDDGNLEDRDGCSSTCTLESVCGNGAVEYGELCDDGGDPENDTCPDDCSPPLDLCGNNELDPGEQCDLGGGNGIGPCLINCVWRGDACTQGVQERQWWEPPRWIVPLEG